VQKLCALEPFVIGYTLSLVHGRAQVTVHTQPLLVAVSRLAITQTRAAGTAAKVAGVNPTSYAILSELSLEGFLTNGQIAERLGMSTGGVTPALDRLERAGLVERSPNPADRRSSIVAITADGEDVLREASGVLATELDPRIDAMDEQERETVLRFLADVSDAYDAVQHRLEP
jgi:DNA-binding MarR family transcriptional regulator